MSIAITPLLDEVDKQAAHWRSDPVAFAIDALGVEPWDDGSGESQADVLRACAAHKLVSTRSGHKVGKSATAAILSLWGYALFDDARVILTAPTYRQVREVLWRDIAKFYKRARVPLGGKISPDSPTTGLRHPAGNQVLGLSTDDPDRFSGISGANVFYIVDEASGVSEAIFDAIHGNRAGGASLWMFGNPTQLAGTFFESHHGNADIYRTFHLDSERVARFNTNERGESRIPGLAWFGWIDERKRAWRPHETHPMYAVRVRGDFPPIGLNTIISLLAWGSARKRWVERFGDGLAYDEGGLKKLHRELARKYPLVIGFDVARFGDDACVLIARRGPVVFPAVSGSYMDSKEAAAWARHHIRSWMRPGEGTGVPGTHAPTVNVDSIGVGSGVFDELARDRWLNAVSVQTSERADLDAEYHNLRAQLWFNTARWLKEEGCVPPDDELRVELLAPQYKFDESGRLKAEPKDEIKERLGRSPDRGDALVMAVYDGGASALRPFHSPNV